MASVVLDATACKSSIGSCKAFPAWANELAAMANMGLELCQSPRRVEPPSRHYHEIAADLLDFGIAEIRTVSNCVGAAAAIATRHRAGTGDWGTLANEAWMAAHHAGPFDSCQWIARAAARSAHGAEEGQPNDIAITAAWVARLFADRRKSWLRIADIVAGAAQEESYNAVNPSAELPSQNAKTVAQPEALQDPGARWHQGLAIIMRRYGFFALDVDSGGGSVTPKLKAVHTKFDDISARGTLCTVVFLRDPSDARLFGLEGEKEVAGALLKESKRTWFHARRPIYRPLFAFVSFGAGGIAPLVQTDSGRIVIGWLTEGSRKILIIGLDIVEELVRYTQGTPHVEEYTGCKNLWGMAHEQPAFLYEKHIVPGLETEPWADKLGMLIAENIAAAIDVPLISPLPSGLQGGIILTGDDDQAWLEKYEEQLSILRDFPITYFLLPYTNHTAETLARLPRSVEFGMHVDALNQPENYEGCCKQQTIEVRDLLGKHPAHAVRNHGHLNNGYWGHLQAWEAAELSFDLNIRGLDGTCPTGSYLPFRVRRLDGSWSSHTSLFSTFSDSMLFLQKWSEDKQIKVIMRLVRQIEVSCPGILVFNFHPQNVSQVARVHRAVMAIARRKGWRAFGVETFRRWLEVIDGVRMTEVNGVLVLRSEAQVTDLALRSAGSPDLCCVPPWRGEIRLPVGRMDKVSA